MSDEWSTDNVVAWVEVELNATRLWLVEQQYRIAQGVGACSDAPEATRARVAEIYGSLQKVIGEVKPSIMAVTRDDPKGEKYGGGIDVTVLSVPISKGGAPSTDDDEKADEAAN